MSDIAIKVENLGKKYLLRHQQQQGRRYKALRDVLADKFKRLVPGKRNPKNQHSTVEEFWALRDVSFEIKQGETVGVIGRNGAGKSTLLKLLSRITEPTKGRIELEGRVASLLEVGTGFHPELTGRENIYLNGAVLGMTHAEIKKSFDEIVAFAEVERFLDTPVKRYSSGMYMRLAFAVAAHLEPEILIVDEVLAVGDAEFQQKCLGKMRSVSQTGRTILFVSHNMQAIKTLCTHVALLEKGSLAYLGDCSSALQIYANHHEYRLASSWQRPQSTAKAPLSFQCIEAEIVENRPHQKLILRMRLETVKAHKPAFMAVDILNESGVALMQALPTIDPFIKSDQEDHDLEMEIDLPPMVPGTYLLTFWVGPHNSYTLDSVTEAVSFQILESPTPGRIVPHTPDHGFIVPFSTVREVTPA